MPLGKKFRRLRMGLQTVFNVSPQGFFIPYRYAGPVRGDAPYPALRRLFDAARPKMQTVLAGLDDIRDDLAAIGDTPPPEPRWGQDWFPRLDAAIGYAMVRNVKPARLIEVGSGHSTRFYRRAARDGGLATAITAIDPAPRADLSELSDITLIRKTVQDADPAVFDSLAAGDILAIDSSHILMPGTDVDELLNRVLPRLPSGIHVHIHDMFLPDAYPPHWAWRGYNEQNAVAALLAGGGYSLDWASHYAVETGLLDGPGGAVVKALPLPDGAVETSLWLTKTAAAL